MTDKKKKSRAPLILGIITFCIVVYAIFTPPLLNFMFPILNLAEYEVPFAKSWNWLNLFQSLSTMQVLAAYTILFIAFFVSALFALITPSRDLSDAYGSASFMTEPELKELLPTYLFLPGEYENIRGDIQTELSAEFNDETFIDEQTIEKITEDIL